MASPAYVTVGAADVTAGATSRSPGLPAGRSNGQLLIAGCGTKNNDVHTWTGTGWTKLDQIDSGAGFTASLAWCIVDGAEATPVCSWTNSSAARAVMTSWSGVAGENPFDGANNSNTGTGTTHSCTGVTTTRADSRVIYIDLVNVSTLTATPSGWTENYDLGSGTSATRHVVGGKDIASSGSASGDISITGGNAEWVMWQIELRSPSAGGVVSPMFYHVLLGACSNV